ncbi:unnamed protein product [Meganyctiphanes norvegica]|uniref:Uncharacterized protein n=1 Tax=Meganyctiphanes norvegica TaxID=48144 RepID=A0AAV2PRX4_MEGNR
MSRPMYIDVPLSHTTPIAQTSFKKTEVPEPDIAWGTDDIKYLFIYLFKQNTADRMEARMKLTNIMGNKTKLNKSTIIDITAKVLKYYEVTAEEAVAFCYERKLFASRCFCNGRGIGDCDSDPAWHSGYKSFEFHEDCAFVTWLASTFNLELKSSKKLYIQLAPKPFAELEAPRSMERYNKPLHADFGRQLIFNWPVGTTK